MLFLQEFSSSTLKVNNLHLPQIFYKEEKDHILFLLYQTAGRIHF